LDTLHDDRPTAPSTTFAQSVAQIERLHRSGPWDRLRLLFHDEARLQSLAAGGVNDPDRTVAAMRKAAVDGVYAMGPWSIEELGQDAILVNARMRHQRRTEAGGPAVADQSYFWLMTGRDSLLWRMRIFTDREAAVECLQRHGPTLDL
jgi:hypothetical protein